MFKPGKPILSPIYDASQTFKRIFLQINTICTCDSAPFFPYGRKKKGIRIKVKVTMSFSIFSHSVILFPWICFDSISKVVLH